MKKYMLKSYSKTNDDAPMNWANLREHKCPKCDEKLTQSFFDSMVKCNGCGFFMGEERYKMIINSMIKK